MELKQQNEILTERIAELEEDQLEFEEDLEAEWQEKFNEKEKADDQIVKDLVEMFKELDQVKEFYIEELQSKYILNAEADYAVLEKTYKAVKLNSKEVS